MLTPMNKLKTFVAKIDDVFGADCTNKIFNGVGVDASNGQIVDLATYEHAIALVDTLIQTPFVGH
jgi:hypothetical protein